MIRVQISESSKTKMKCVLCDTDLEDLEKITKLCEKDTKEFDKLLSKQRFKQNEIQNVYEKIFVL